VAANDVIVRVNAAPTDMRHGRSRRLLGGGFDGLICGRIFGVIRREAMATKVAVIRSGDVSANMTASPSHAVRL
jgi:hypothetical protein